MSLCRSKTYKEIENNLAGEKLRKVKTINSNKICSKNTVIIRNLHSSQKIEISNLLNLKNAETNKKGEIILEPQPFTKSTDNHEKSTFFFDNNDHNKDIIRESEIVFEVIDNRDTEGYHKSSAQKKWGVILNVFKVINNMKNINTKNVKSMTELDKSFDLFEKNHPKGKKNNTHIVRKCNDHGLDDNFEEITKQIKFFEFISSGLEEHIGEIIAMIKNDPLRNLYDESEKQKYFVNQKNMDGFTALYITCMNGQCKLAEILIKNSADHLQKFINEEEEQSVLDVAIRWGHTKLVEYLLTLKWPLDYLKKGLKQALDRKNEKMIKMIRKSIALHKINEKKWCSCFG